MRSDIVDEQAKNLFGDGRHGERSWLDEPADLDRWDTAVALDPQDAAAWCRRGMELDKLGQCEEAVVSFDRALAIDPKLAQAWYERGHVLRHLQRHQESIESYERTLALAPDDGEIWLRRGHVLWYLGQRREAVESFDRALACGYRLGNKWVWIDRGHAWYHLGRYQEAIESYDKALALLEELDEDDERALGALQDDADEYEQYLDGLWGTLVADWEEVWAAKNKALDRLQEWLDAQRPPPLFDQLYKQVAAGEERLHMCVRQRLEKEFGEGEEEWWVKGVPLPIRQKCAQRREEDPRRRPLYNYTDLIDLKQIMDKNWKLFDADFQRIKEKKTKSRKEFLNNLARLNEIRKTVMHPVRDAPTEQDLEFAKHIRQVIEEFAGTG